MRAALALVSGDDYAVADISNCAGLGNAEVATYAATVRQGGEADGEIVGILAIHFDWAMQARAIVEGVRLAPRERDRTIVMLVDRNNRIIASTANDTQRAATFDLITSGRPSGYYDAANGQKIAFHATPGYETYRGLGWHGVIVRAAD